jgi:hypothetical protein
MSLWLFEKPGRHRRFDILCQRQHLSLYISAFCLSWHTSGVESLLHKYIAEHEGESHASHFHRSRLHLSRHAFQVRLSAKPNASPASRNCRPVTKNCSRDLVFRPSRHPQNHLHLLRPLCLSFLLMTRAHEKQPACLATRFPQRPAKSTSRLRHPRRALTRTNMQRARPKR